MLPDRHYPLVTVPFLDFVRSLFAELIVTTQIIGLVLDHFRTMRVISIYLFSHYVKQKGQWFSMQKAYCLRQCVRHITS